MEWRLALPILLVAVLFSPIGVHVSQGLDRQRLLWLFSAFLVFASLMMLFYRPKPSAVARSPRSQILRGSLLGGIAGFVGGLLGVGGGSIIVPSLVGSGVDPKRASATSSFVVVFACLVAFASHARLAVVDYALIGVTAIASASGAFLGAWLMSEKLKSHQLKYILGLVLLATSIKIISGLV